MIEWLNAETANQIRRPSIQHHTFTPLSVLASAFVLIARRWSNLLAALLTLPLVLWFCYVALKVHEVIPSSPAEKEFVGDAASWRQFLWNHPAVFLQYVLAAVVLAVGAIYLIRPVIWKRMTLSGG